MFLTKLLINCAVLLIQGKLICSDDLNATCREFFQFVFNTRKQWEYKQLAKKIPFDVFGLIRKKKSDEDRFVPSKAKLFLLSVFTSLSKACGSNFREVVVNVQNKVSHRTIKQL